MRIMKAIFLMMVLGLLVVGCAELFVRSDNTANTRDLANNTNLENPEKKPVEEPRICTLEWAPVCGINGVTYGNKCQAGDVEIAYEGEC